MLMATLVQMVKLIVLEVLSPGLRKDPPFRLRTLAALLGKMTTITLTPGKAPKENAQTIQVQIATMAIATPITTTTGLQL